MLFILICLFLASCAAVAATTIGWSDRGTWIENFLSQSYVVHDVIDHTFHFLAADIRQLVARWMSIVIILVVVVVLTLSWLSWLMTIIILMMAIILQSLTSLPHTKNATESLESLHVFKWENLLCPSRACTKVAAVLFIVHVSLDCIMSGVVESLWIFRHQSVHPQEFNSLPLCFGLSSLGLYMIMVDYWNRGNRTQHNSRHERPALPTWNFGYTWSCIGSVGLLPAQK